MTRAAGVEGTAAGTAADAAAPPQLPAAAAIDDASQTVSTARFLQLFSSVMVPMFLAVADQTLLATATPRIAAELGGLRDTTWIALGYMIAMTVTTPLYGRLGDRYGRRDMLLVAMGLFAAGSLGCGLAQNLAQLIASRVFQGLGGGGLIVLSQALVGELVPPRQRARFQAYFATNYSLGSIGGPIIGGLVVHHGSWRWLFLANLPLCAVAAWRLRRMPQMHSLDARPIADGAGAALFAAAATTTLLWVSFAGHRFAWISPASGGLIGASAALWWLLAHRELHHAEPFLPVELLRERTVRFMALAVVCFGACMFSLVFFLPIFLQLGRGHDARESGLLLLPVTIGIVVGSTLTGRLIARFGRPAIMPTAGLALSGTALLLMALLPMQASGLTSLGLACGVGLGTVMSTAQVLVQWCAGRERLGAATAIVSLSRATGSALGTACFGAVVFALLPTEAPLAAGAANGASEGFALPGGQAEAVTFAFRVAFAGAAGVAYLGAYFASRIRQVRI
jgi:EmrB/QacA subfamily drug resistance transporter